MHFHKNNFSRAFPALSCPADRPGTRGFMLLEVVIAVGIFSFAMIGLATTMTRLIDVELESREQQRLRLEVQSRLAEARLAEIAPGTVEIGTDGHGVIYTREIEVLELRNEEDEILQGMFLLKIIASKEDEVVQSAEVMVNANARF